MFCSRTNLPRFILMAICLFLFTGCAAIQPKAKADYTVDVAGMDFAFVKGGTFQMGSNQNSDEQPVHSVNIDDLFVGMYEVTFEQFDQYCETSPQCETPSDKKWGRGNRPAINVSWNASNAYAEWLSEQTGLKFRLPTEAEWEYFARGGTTTPYWTGKTLPKGSANCKDCGSKWDNKMTAPVGSFAPNPWKIYDTAGNVVEWVLDDFEKGYENAPTDGSALVIADRNRKVQRGGAWSYSSDELRSAARDYRRPNSAKDDTGFRLVLIPTEQIPLPPVK